MEKRLNDYPPSMKPREVCEVLGISQSTLCKWRRQGVGSLQPVLNVGRTIRYSRTDVKRLLETGNVRP